MDPCNSLVAEQHLFVKNVLLTCASKLLPGTLEITEKGYTTVILQLFGLEEFHMKLISNWDVSSSLFFFI